MIGSELIGQNFTKPGYFHGRPSATTDVDPKDSTKTVPAPYNAANSSGSNAGPTAKSLAERVQEDVKALKEENPNAPIPIDLVTTSASGLDPDISPEAALFQVPRVAKERKLDEAQVLPDLSRRKPRSAPWRPRGAAGQRAETQHGARRLKPR